MKINNFFLIRMDEGIVIGAVTHMLGSEQNTLHNHFQS